MLIHPSAPFADYPRTWLSELGTHGSFMCVRSRGIICWSTLTQPTVMNLSHVIDEFSFGPYFPRIVQPLDNSAYVLAQLTRSIATKLTLRYLHSEITQARE